MTQQYYKLFVQELPAIFNQNLAASSPLSFSPLQGGKDKGGGYNDKTGGRFCF